MKRIIILLACVPISATAADLLADGELCLNSLQCASGVCLRQDGLSLARCAPKAQLGEECSAFDLGEGVYYKPICETGLACVPTTGSIDFGICVDLNSNCPSGYIEVDEPYLTITERFACASDMTYVGTAISCLAENPSGNCIMYIPSDVTINDDTGIYKYTEPCASE